MTPDNDPYSRLLGLSKGPRPPDHYTLLGLERFTFEPPIIADAAEARLAILEAAERGPHSAAASKLRAEVATAEKTLLDPAARAAYDARLRQAMAASTPPSAPDAPAVPEANEPGDRDEFVIHSGGRGGKATSHRVAPRAARRSASARGKLGMVALACCVLLGAVIFAYRDRLFAGNRDVSNQFAQADASGAKEIATGGESAARAEPEAMAPVQKSPAVIETNEPAVEPPTAKEVAPRGGKKKKKKASGTASMASDAMPEAAATGAKPKAGMTSDAPLIDFATLPGVSAEATSAERALVDRAIRAAVAALADRDMNRAAEQCDLAVLTATSADTTRESDTARTAVELTSHFWTSVEGAMASLAPDTEINVGDRALRVTAVASGSFTARDGATSRVYSLKNLPTDLALALVAKKSPVAGTRDALAQAAFLAFDARGDIGTARQRLSAVESPEGAAVLSLLESR